MSDIYVPTLANSATTSNPHALRNIYGCSLTLYRFNNIFRFHHHLSAQRLGTLQALLSLDGISKPQLIIDVAETGIILVTYFDFEHKVLKVQL